MVKFTSRDEKRIRELRRRFPKQIAVEVRPAQTGGFWAELTSFPGCVTQAETFSELIDMVNDATATVLEVPQKYLSYMPTYLPPVSLAQRLGIFPRPKSRVVRTVVFSRA